MSQNLEESERVPSARGWTWGAWLSEAPLLPADGPYLVIVEQPKQVSEPEGCDGLGFGDKWDIRRDWIVGCCWAVGQEVSRRHTIGHVVSDGQWLPCVCVGGGWSPDLIVSVMEPTVSEASDFDMDVKAPPTEASQVPPVKRAARPILLSR